MPAVTAFAEGTMADHRHHHPLVTDVRITKGSPAEVREGLIGYVECTLVGAIVITLTLRLTADRRPALSFPKRKDSRGNKHSLAKPIDQSVRIQIENEVFKALGINQEGDLGGT